MDAYVISQLSGPSQSFCGAIFEIVAVVVVWGALFGGLIISISPLVGYVFGKGK